MVDGDDDDDAGRGTAGSPAVFGEEGVGGEEASIRLGGIDAERDGGASAIREDWLGAVAVAVVVHRLEPVGLRETVVEAFIVLT